MTGILRVMVVALATGIAGCASTTTGSLASYAPTLDPAPTPPQGLRAQFFGTTTVLIRDDKNAIMIDGFFSRPDALQLLLGKIEPDPVRIGEALNRGNVPDLDYLLVSHSHHDHAMDAPIVAEGRHATLVGSESTREIALGSGRYKLRFHLARAGEHVSAGLFKVTFFETAHAPYRFENPSRRSRDPIDPFRAWLDEKLAGEIKEPLSTPARFTEYKFGGNYVFLIEHPQGRILVVPSASVPHGLGNTKVDVVFLSIGDADKLSKKHIVAYWKKAVENTDARLVIPVHWDNLAGSLGAPLETPPPFFDDVGCAMQTLRFLNAGRAAIAFMPLFEPVALDVAHLRVAERSVDTSDTINPFTQGCRKGD